MNRTTVSVEVTRGDQALLRLDDASLVEAWGRLHATCAWATTFQTFAFVDAWYRLHESIYEPVIVEGRDERDRLVGLLTLARRRTGRLLVGAGDFHAEYQTWIADDPAVEPFLRGSLRLLERTFPRGRLRLMYVPATAPLGWIDSDSRWPRRIHLRPRSGGFMDLSDPARIEESLQKGHNRNRLNGLRRSGEVTLESIHTVEGLMREMDEIAVLCDLRQGAVNDSLPFTNNPLKAPLHVEMMRRGLLRVTILRVGAAIGSAHLDVKTGDDVLLYLAAHAPRFARHSPGSLHILLLAQQLATEGVRRFDLSPGGGYKDRYADGNETVVTLNARFGFADRVILDLAGRVEAGATSLLSLAGQTPRSALAGVRRVRARVTNIVTRRPASSAPLADRRIYRLPDEPLRGDVGLLAADCLEDLLAYRPEDRGDPPMRAFLLLALHRLELGHRVLTRRDGDRLVECWWICRVEGQAEGRGKGRQNDFYSASVILAYDPLLVPVSGRPEPRLDLLARLRSTTQWLAPGSMTVLALSVDDGDLEGALIDHGVVGTEIDAIRPLESRVETGADPAPGLAPFLEDLGRKLAAGWPVERSDR